MASESGSIYSRIGRELAAFLAQRPEGRADPVVLAAVVADLAGSAQELITPLKDLVHRPGFTALASRAGSGSGALQRDALLNELSAIYSSQVISGFTDLLNALLDLPARNTAPPASFPAATAPLPAPVAGERAEPSAAMATRVPAPAPRQRDGSWALLASTGLAAALLAAVAGTLLRQPALCRSFGLCPAEQAGATASMRIERAHRSAWALQRAASLPQLEQALAQLDQDLGRIDRQTLSAAQAEQVSQLDDLASSWRQRREREASASQLLAQASRAVAAAENATDAATRAELGQQARQALEGIPAESFVTAEAQALATTLSRLAEPVRATEQLPQAGSDGPETDSTAPPGTAPTSPPAEIPAGPPTPAPVEPEPTGSAAGTHSTSLPPLWEERRARRREILNQYRQGGGE
ncbi:MAG: hypothetical protein VKI63_09380 [Cyanobium sp.]|nr:hypothetical protein [Cyanobium sp.]